MSLIDQKSESNPEEFSIKQTIIDSYNTLILFPQTFIIIVSIVTLSNSFGRLADISGNGSAFARPSGLMVFFLVILAILSVVISALFSGAMIISSVAAVTRTEISIKTAVTAGLRRFWDFVGAAFVFGVILFFGFLLLIAPGVYLFLRYLFLVPIVIIEKKGISDAMRRSAELTEGHRVKIGLTFLIFVPVSIVVYGLAGALIYLLGSVGFILSVILGAALNIAFYTVNAQMYVRLRALAGDACRPDAELV